MNIDYAFLSLIYWRMVDAILGRWTYGKFNSPSSISATILSSLTFTASLHLFIWFSFLSIRTWSTITRVFSPILSTALHGLTPHLSHSSFLSFYSLLICSCVYFLGLVSLRLTVGLTLYFSLQVMEMRRPQNPVPFLQTSTHPRSFAEPFPYFQYLLFYWWSS